LKHQTRQPKYHFKKHLKVTCPNHSYPIKQKLKDCNMIKNFKTLGAFSKGRKPEGGLRGKGATPIPEEVEVMPIFN
jgi:hypothetical protein